MKKSECSPGRGRGDEPESGIDNPVIHLLNWRDAPSCGGEPYSDNGTTDLRRVSCPNCLALLKAAQQE